MGAVMIPERRERYVQPGLSVNLNPNKLLKSFPNKNFDCNNQKLLSVVQQANMKMANIRGRSYHPLRSSSPSGLLSIILLANSSSSIRLRCPAHLNIETLIYVKFSSSIQVYFLLLLLLQSKCIFFLFTTYTFAHRKETFGEA